MSGFIADLSVLPPHQRRLWDELGAIPRDFVLYGGTGIALRLGHRASVDFDLMTERSFTPDSLVREVPLLAGAERLQSQADTLTVSISRGAPVKLSFFGGIAFGRVGRPDRAPDNHLCIASLLDLAATKVAVVQQRAEAKDYRDLEAILRAGLSLEEALAAGACIYGTAFNPAITLKALAYFEDGDLPSLFPATRAFLAERSAQIGPIPVLARASGSILPDPSQGR